ncbi:hypothetical protein ABW19_dt0208515 [Dactylella cylindrospora]|nr:hypothetical protein ABW19_dt0208515 [Dactylella cylindrospora]
MLPLKVITGEADARRAGGSRPPSAAVFDAISNSPYADSDDFDSESIYAPAVRYSQPRSMPSPPLAYDVSIDNMSTVPESPTRAHAQTQTHPHPRSHQRSHSAKLHGLGLNVFKHGIKTNLHSSGSSGHRSNPTSPLVKSPASSRRRSIGFFGSQASSGSPNSKHSRHFSNHAFANEFGPKPPISPTPSSEAKSSPTQSPVAQKFPPTSYGHSQQSSFSSTYSRFSGGVILNQESPRVGHVHNLDNWTQSYLNNNNNRSRGQKRSSGRRERTSEAMSESSQSEASSPSYTHSQPVSGGGRAVFNYDLTPESHNGSFPNSPRQEEERSQMLEVEGPKMAPILQARLSSMYTLSSYNGRDTGLWSTRSAAYTSMTSVDTSRPKFISMDTDESDLMELEEMMTDMKSSETSAEKEIRLLMQEMLVGQEVVRRPGEVTSMELIPSPQLPQLIEEEEEEETDFEIEPSPAQIPAEFDMTKSADWKDIERWAGIGTQVEYPRESSILTGDDKSEIDDESMDEEDYEQLEMEAEMDRMSMRSSRHPAEDEGLNEMSFDYSIPMPEIPAEYDISTPKQAYAQSLNEEQVEEEEELDPEAEYTLGVGVSFEELDLVNEELKLEYEAEDEAERLRQMEAAKTLTLEIPGSRPGTQDGSRPGTKDGLPQLSLLEVPPPNYGAGKATLESPTSGEESPYEIKGKAADFSRGGRRHNLKENEIRVEDPAYLIAFKKFLKPSVHTDAFVSRQTRFDGFQTRRICNELPHEYRPLPPPPPKAEPEPTPQPAKPSWQMEEEDRVLSMTPEQRRAKEVSDEITSRLWVFMAAKWLHYGRILVSPAHDILNQAAQERRKNKNAVPPPVRRRILDLGGAPVADWGWHCAYEYPHSKVYTVTSRPKNINIDNVPIAGLGVIEKRRFTGPSNHRHIKVSSLWKLPFPDNHFDVISARSLQTILKQTPPPKRRSERNNRHSKTPRLDEYSLTLKECYRVLKPGGHFEWSLTDSDVVRAGPSTQELATEFAHELRSRGYDPTPTSRWINRLANTGFVSTKRTWTVLPMAAPAIKPKVAPKRTLGKSFEDDLKAAQEEMQAELKAWEELGVVKGSTKDVAPLTGILGTWRWEEWMVKVDGERENPAWKKGLVNGITSAVDEGREMGSGWRCLVGWTRKPTKLEQARMEKKKAALVGKK